MDNRHWLTDVSPQKYHQLAGIGSSALRSFVKDGPLDYYAKYVAKTKQTDSEAFRLGRAFHKAMETEHWQDYIVRVPTTIEQCEYYDLAVMHLESRPNSKAKIPKPGDAVNKRQEFDRLYVRLFEQHAAIHDCDFLDDDEIGLVRFQVKAVRENQAIVELLEQDCQAESAVTLKVGNLTAKALLDLHSGTDWFADFKTTKARNPHQFWYEFQRHGYDFQIAHYRLVSGIKCHKVIYVTKEPPFEAQVMDVPFAIIEDRLQDVERHLRDLDQLHTQASETDERDCNGIPFVFHNEPWGAEIDPVEMFIGGSLPEVETYEESFT